MCCYLGFQGENKAVTPSPQKYQAQRGGNNLLFPIKDLSVQHIKGWACSLLGKVHHSSTGFIRFLTILYCQNSRNRVVCISKSGCFYQFFFLQFNLEEKPRVYSLGEKKKKRKKIKNLVLICITPNLSNATIHYSSLPCCSVGIYISKHISISHCRKLNKPGTTSAAFQPLAFYELQMQRFNSKLGVYLWSDSM